MSGQNIWDDTVETPEYCEEIVVLYMKDSQVTKRNAEPLIIYSFLDH